MMTDLLLDVDKPLSALVYIKPQQDIRYFDPSGGDGMRHEPTVNQQRIEYLSPSSVPSPSLSTSPSSSSFRHIQPKFDPLLSSPDAIFEDITTPSPSHTSPAIPPPPLGDETDPDWHWLSNDTQFLDLLGEENSATNPTERNSPSQLAPSPGVDDLQLPPDLDDFLLRSPSRPV